MCKAAWLGNPWTPLAVLVLHLNMYYFQYFLKILNTMYDLLFAIICILVHFGIIIIIQLAYFNLGDSLWKWVNISSRLNIFIFLHSKVWKIHQTWPSVSITSLVLSLATAWMWIGQVGALMTVKWWKTYIQQKRAFLRASANLWPFGMPTDFQSKKTGSVVRCSSLTPPQSPVITEWNQIYSHTQANKIRSSMDNRIL